MNRSALFLVCTLLLASVVIINQATAVMMPPNGPLAEINLDTLVKGSSFAPEKCTALNLVVLEGSPGETAGTMCGEVFWSPIDSFYSYVFRVTPDLAGINTLLTNFEVVGFNGQAGYSYSQVLANDISTNIEYNSGLVSWTFTGWNVDETFTVFYRSDLPPTDPQYTIILSNGGFALNDSYAPLATAVPEPSTIFLLCLGFIGLGLARMVMRRKPRY